MGYIVHPNNSETGNNTRLVDRHKMPPSLLGGGVTAVMRRLCVFLCLFRFEQAVASFFATIDYVYLARFVVLEDEEGVP